jgi:hypothetical protein
VPSPPRRDFVLTDRAYRHNTRPHDLAAHDYSAGCALRHATSESGSAQLKLVVQNKQQRRFSEPIWRDFLQADFGITSSEFALKRNPRLAQPVIRLESRINGH